MSNQSKILCAVSSAQLAIPPSADEHTMSNTHVAHLPLHAVKREDVADQALVLALEKAASLGCDNTGGILRMGSKYATSI